MENTNTPSIKKNAWFGSIETQEECLKAIKESSYAFFFMALLWIIVSFFVPMDIWIDVALFLILGTILFKFKSRVAAILLLLLSAGDLILTIINKLSQQASGATGGTNVFLGVIILWAGVRAVQASFKFQKLKKTQVLIAKGEASHSEASI